MNKWQLKWLYLGLYFGYPKCCIMGFVRDTGLSYWTRMCNRYPSEESLRLDYVRCHSCVASGKMDLLPSRREEYYSIAQGIHEKDYPGQDLRLIKRERDLVNIL